MQTTEAESGITLEGLGRRIESEFRQVGALVNLHHLVPVTSALPPSTVFSARPDFLLLLVAEIQRLRPALVIEAGSGASTIWMASALRHFGIPGRVVSLEHDEEYAAATRESLQRHLLQSFAEVRGAPLVDQDIDGGRWNWYDPAQVSDLRDIGFIVVDGPPGHLRPLSRYPALPLLEARTVPGAVLVLDDAGRPDEQRVIDRWRDDFPAWDCTTHRHYERGAAVFTKPGR